MITPLSIKLSATRWAKSCSTILVMALSCAFLQAGAQTISDLETTIAQLNASGNSQGQELDALAHDVQTTIRFTGSSFEIYGEGTAAVLDVDASSISALNFSSPEIQSVQLIRVRINSVSDFQSQLSSNLFELGNLKYVVLLSSIEATPANFSQIVPGTGTQSVGFFYSVSIPN